jgi:hypothetical protein
VNSRHQHRCHHYHHLAAAAAALLRVRDALPPQFLFPPFSGVMCSLSDRSQVLASFLRDDFVSLSLDINGMTQRELEEPLTINSVCYGVASTTFDTM